MTKHSESSDFAILDGTARAHDGTNSVRGALRAWLARLVADADLDSEHDVAATPARIATSFENRVSRLRANARAAYGSVEGARRVEGADFSALDAALDVLEAEWRAVLAERDRCAEALKAIQVYAPDSRCRAMATQGLTASAAPREVPAYAFLAQHHV